jgi:hypothetical protein
MRHLSLILSLSIISHTLAAPGMAFPSASESVAWVPKTDTFLREALVLDFLYSMKGNLINRRFGANKIAAIYPTLNGGATRALDDSNDSGITITGSKVKWNQHKLSHWGSNPNVQKLVTAAMERVSRVPNSKLESETFSLHIVPDEHGPDYDAMAYMDPTPEAPKIAIRESVFKALLRELESGRPVVEAARVLAFILQHELRHSVGGDRSVQFRAEDELQRILDDFRLLTAKSFLSEPSLEIVRTNPELLSLNNYVTYLQSFRSESKSTREKSFAEQAWAVAESSEIYMTMPGMPPRHVYDHSKPSDLRGQVATASLMLRRAFLLGGAGVKTETLTLLDHGPVLAYLSVPTPLAHRTKSAWKYFLHLFMAMWIVVRIPQNHTLHSAA